MSLHERSRKLAAAELDFGLAATERAELRDHLAACPDCRVHVDALRRDAALLEHMAAIEAARAGVGGASAAVRSRVLAAAESAGRRPTPAVRRMLQLAVLALIAALVVGLTAVVYVGSRQLLKAVKPTPDLTGRAAGTLTGVVDASGRLPPEPDYCRISSGDHRSPDCRIGLAAGAGSIWTTAGQGVVRVDPDTDAITATVRLESDPRDLVFLDGMLYAATWAGTIERIDPRTDAVEGSIRASDQPLAAMAAAPDGSLWVTVRGAGEVVRVDPAGGDVLARVPVGGEPYDVAVAGDSAWVSDRTHDLVTRVDAGTNQAVGTVNLPGLEPRDLAATPTGIWVIGAGEIALIDPATAAVTRRLPAATLANLGSGPSALWVAGLVNAALQRVDPATGDVLGRTSLEDTVDAPDPEAAVLEADGVAWVAVYGSPNLLRVEVGP